MRFRLRSRRDGRPSGTARLPWRPVMLALAGVSTLLVAHHANGALVRRDGSDDPAIAIALARLEVEHERSIARRIEGKLEAMQLERQALTADRRAMLAAIERLKQMLDAVHADKRALEGERAGIDKRVGDLDEALQAASVALVRQERQASSGDREEKTLGLRAWIATLGSKRALARQQQAAMRKSGENLAGRGAAMERSLKALGLSMAQLDRQLEPRLGVRHFQDLLLTRQEWKLLAAEKRLRTVRQQVWMAADDRERRRREHPSAGALAVIVADVGASHPDDSADESGSGAGDQRLAALADGDGERSFGGGPSIQLDALPIQGRILHKFGEHDGVRMSSGITIAGEAGDEVIAPVGGRVVFSGAFKDYGLLLIIDHGNEYHTLLTGFDEIDAAEGDIVRAGQKVGRLAQRQDSNPRLYLELRSRGIPVNPLPWLAARSDKVRG